jgi:hypothetical protein
VGVYRSRDGGDRWALMTDRAFPDLRPAIRSSRCSRLVVHPTNPNLVYVAGDGGVDRWDEAAGTWRPILDGDTSDLAMDPSNPRRLYAPSEITPEAIWVTDDAEAPPAANGLRQVTWRPMTRGLTVPQFTNRFIKLAVAPSDPTVLYAVVNVEAQGPDENGVLRWENRGAAVYRWDGSAWVDKGVRISATYSFWCSLIAVHPTDPNYVVAAGVHLGWSPDGGDHWYGRSSGHVDNHSMVFHPDDPNVTLLANDGGVWTHTEVPGRTVSGFVAVHAPELGGLDVFGRAGDQLSHRWLRPQADGTLGGGWEFLGGPIRGTPTAVRAPDAGGIDVFARWADDTLRRRSWRPATGWSPWVSHGGALAGDPVAVHAPERGGVDVFARGADGALHHFRWRAGAAGVWRARGGTLTSNPAAVAAPDTPGLAIFARGLDGALWHLAWRTGQGWGTWESRGGRLEGNPTAVHTPAARGLDVFARAPDATLGHWAWRPGAGWEAWRSRGGSIADDPFAHYSPDRGGLDVYARGRLGDLRHFAWRPGAGWAEESLGGWIATAGPVAARASDLGGADLFLRGPDAQLYHSYWRNGADGWQPKDEYGRPAVEALGLDVDWRYRSANQHLVTTQFYNVSVSQGWPRRESNVQLTPDRRFAIGGSTQDQGILKSDGSSAFIGLGGNEGGIFAIDPSDGNRIYWDPWDGNLRVTDDGTGRGMRDASNGLETVNEARGAKESPTALAIHPTDPAVLVCATSSLRAYFSSDGAAAAPATGWTRVVDDTGAAVRRIAFAPSAPSRVYWVTDAGAVWRSDDQGRSWAAVSDASLPAGPLQGLAVDWNDPDTVFVTYVGVFFPSSIGHVWMSEDGGVSWRDISGKPRRPVRPRPGELVFPPPRRGGRLPNVPFLAIVQRYGQPDTLYAATELGPFRTTDRGHAWAPFDEGLPNAVVSDMAYRLGADELYVSTIGRGMWARRL